MEKGYRHFALAGISGILLALAYPRWGIDLGFLVWIGFVPFLWALNQFAYKSDRFYRRIEFFKQSFLIGFATGLFYFLIIFRWFWSIHPLDTLGIQGRLASLIIVFLLYAISSAGMAVFWGLASAAISYQLSAISKKGAFSPIFSGLSMASVFTLAEYARSWGFGLLWAGSETLFGPHWTLGNLAYTLADNNLALKFSSYFGIYGLSFLVVLVNLLFFKILAGSQITTDTFAHRAKVSVVILAILLLTFGPRVFNQKSPLTGREINFTVIQTNQPTKISPSPREALNAFKEQLELLNRIAKEYPESQLIVFPEASDFFKNLSLFLAGPQIPNYFSNLFKESRLIISGARVIDTDGRAYSRVFALDTKEDITGFYDKRLLTPQGEFLSYPTKFIVNLFSKTKVSEFGALRELGVGKGKISTVSFRDQYSVAPLVCSEILSPSLARKTTQGADTIVGMASYGVFRGSAALVKQNLAIAQFRAAENRRPLIAASNMGLSYAIDSDGNIVKIAPNQASQILTGAIALNPQKSWYNKVGDAPVLLGCLGLAVIVFSVQWLVLRRLVFDKNSKP